MSDKIKLKLIQDLISNYYETCSLNDETLQHGQAENLISSIGVIIEFKEEGTEDGYSEDSVC